MNIITKGEGVHKSIALCNKVHEGGVYKSIALYNKVHKGGVHVTPMPPPPPPPGSATAFVEQYTVYA